jgi:hypothetical protein
MNNRERWIIYPLLFFAISLAAKTQMDQAFELDTGQVVCRELRVVDRRGDVQLRLTADRAGGLLVLQDRRQAAAVVLNAVASGGGQVLVVGDNDLAAAELRGTPAGGQVQLWGANGQPAILLGYPSGSGPAGLTAVRDQQVVDDADGVPWGVPLPMANESSGPSQRSGAPSQTKPEAEQAGGADGRPL